MITITLLFSTDKIKNNNLTISYATTAKLVSSNSKSTAVSTTFTSVSDSNQEFTAHNWSFALF